jgi:hypothetical protein
MNLWLYVKPDVGYLHLPLVGEVHYVDEQEGHITADKDGFMHEHPHPATMLVHSPCLVKEPESQGRKRTQGRQRTDGERHGGSVYGSWPAFHGPTSSCARAVRALLRLRRRP